LAQSQQALQFDGVNDWVTFGPAPGLGVSTFTIEVRFKRTGLGSTANTGTGGVVAVPLLSKGRSESDGSNLDMNFFLGIRGRDNVLVADYEEGTGQTSPGLNHPVAGITPIATGTWYHAAATFDGTTWRLYLDGNLEATLVRTQSEIQAGRSVEILSANGLIARWGLNLQLTAFTIETWFRRDGSGIGSLNRID
jgi:hypothetical protein